MPQSHHRPCFAGTANRRSIVSEQPVYDCHGGRSLPPGWHEACGKPIGSCELTSIPAAAPDMAPPVAGEFRRRGGAHRSLRAAWAENPPRRRARSAVSGSGNASYKQIRLAILFGYMPGVGDPPAECKEMTGDAAAPTMGPKSGGKAPCGGVCYQNCAAAPSYDGSHR